MAMSGGVDSSVAAAVLLRRGYEVVGVFMRLGTPDGVADADQGDACQSPGVARKQGCCSVSDATDARRVAQQLEIPFYVLNFQDDFGRVIDYFVEEYNRGRTPNPCVRCNDWLKFGRLSQYAQAVGADYVASGHYARIGPDPITAEPSLLRGVDRRKDQSYVLFGMSRPTLEHTLLPIGEYEKPRVRELAREFGLAVFDKPDSQEICFVPDQDYAALVQRRTPGTVRPGEIVTSDGRVAGQHPGHQHFTIGQRKGTGLSGGRPLYVLNIDAAGNRITVGGRDELEAGGLTAADANFLSTRAAGARDMPCQAKIRYNHAPAPARFTADGKDRFTVRFDTPQSAITPGQAVVLYNGDVLLAGGWIESAQT